MSARLKINPGDRYGKLTIIEEVESLIRVNGKKERQFKCVCDCSNIRNYVIYRLRTGHTNSCGCYAKEQESKTGKLTKNLYPKLNHNDYNTPEFRAWKSMKNRCYSKFNNRYHRYGGRGIIVCNRWLESYQNFLEDMGRKPGKEYSIDRKDNDGNYEPGNCKWSTPIEQSNNRGSNKK